MVHPDFPGVNLVIDVRQDRDRQDPQVEWRGSGRLMGSKS
jgi:hypothetical protein